MGLHGNVDGVSEDGYDRGSDKSLRWRSRRGMLELELALAPFVQTCLDTLPAADRKRYAGLLEHDDWDIYDWIQGRSEPADPELAAIVALIRSADAR